MTVHGVPQTIAALEARKRIAQAVSPLAARAGGQAVQVTARAVAPKDTGALAASITVEMDGATAQIGPTVDYARFPNFGTRYIRAQHYMEGAAVAASPLVVVAMAAVYKTAIR